MRCCFWKTTIVQECVVVDARRREKWSSNYKSASHFENNNQRVIIKTHQKMHFSRRRSCTLLWQLNGKEHVWVREIIYYLVSLGGSPAVVSCTGWWVHGPMKPEAKPTDIHLDPTEQSTLICVSLAPVLPVLHLLSLHRARAHTETPKRERADAQPIFTKIAALCIWSTQRKLERVTWTARWHWRQLQRGAGWNTAPTCWDRAVQIWESCECTL